MARVYETFFFETKTGILTTSGQGTPSFRNKLAEMCYLYIVERVGEAGSTRVMHGRSRVTVDPRIPAMPEEKGWRGTGGTDMLLGFVIWPLTTHPFRDRAPSERGGEVGRGAGEGRAGRGGYGNRSGLARG